MSRYAKTHLSVDFFIYAARIIGLIVVGKALVQGNVTI
jgi:hypothetical protein